MNERQSWLQTKTHLSPIVNTQGLSRRARTKIERPQWMQTKTNLLPPIINTPDPEPVEGMAEVKKSSRRPILQRLRAVEARYRYMYA